jgi:hypothetical protein
MLRPCARPDERDANADLRSDHVTLRNLPERLRELRWDPWEGYETLRQRIEPKMMQALHLLLR